MKQKIHPQYFPKTKVKCACGAEYTVGSTRESLGIEVCAKCHPFYTGKDKIVDKSGMVEKFKQKIAKAKGQKTSKKKKLAFALSSYGGQRKAQKMGKHL